MRKRGKKDKRNREEKEKKGFESGQGKGCFEGERCTKSQSESKQIGAQVKESHHATESEIINPTNLSKTLTPNYVCMYVRSSSCQFSN